MAECQVRYGPALQADGHLHITTVPGGRLHVRCMSRIHVWSIEADITAEVVELLRVALESAEKEMARNG